jgi:hypothetical protein
MSRLLFCLALCCVSLWAQQTSTTPDCVSSGNTFAFTANGDSQAIQARSTPTAQPCVSWRVTYEAPATVTGLTVTLQGAPDNGSGAPGAWVTFAGAVDDGSNPMSTLTTGAFNVRPGTSGVYYPWVRVDLSAYSGSGTINTKVLGYRGTAPEPPPPAAASGCAGTSTTPCVVDGPNAAGTAPTKPPVFTAGFDGTNVQDIRTDTSGQLVPSGVASANADGTTNTPNQPQVGIAGTPGLAKYTTRPENFNGSTWDRNFVCPSSVDVALSGTGLTEIVAGTASQVIRICNLFVTSVSAGTPVVNTFTVSTATITSCASPTQLLLAGGVTGLDSIFNGTLRSGSGQSICVSESTANSDKVTITYVKY